VNFESTPTMKAERVYLAAFRINAVFDPLALLRKRVHQISAEEPLTNISVPVNEEKLQISSHSRTISRRFPTCILHATIDDVEYLVGTTGIGFAVVRDCDRSLSEVHKDHSEAIESAALIISHQIRAAEPDIYVNPPQDLELLPPNQILWWHSIFLGGCTDLDDLDAEMRDFLSHESDARLRVQYLFSVFKPDSLQETGALTNVIYGLLLATEDWVVADTTNRILTKHLTAMHEALSHDNHKLLEKLMVEGDTLTTTGQCLQLYLDERDRYTAVTRRSAWSLARKAWGIENELLDLQNKIATAVQQTATATKRIGQRSDSYRNLVLFAIALLTALQGTLLVIDFAVHNDFSVEVPIRALLAVLSLVFSIGLGIYLIGIYWIRNRPRNAKTQAAVLSEDPFRKS
jgi:hypothetical protein